MRLLLLSLALASVAVAQLQIDPRIAAEIVKIKTIDNHAHPVLPAPGDSEYDALPVDHMDPYTEPIRTRAGANGLGVRVHVIDREGVVLAVAWSGQNGMRMVVDGFDFDDFSRDAGIDL